MGNRSLIIVVLFLSTTIFSCRKADSISCHTPIADEIRGVWKQDYVPDPGAFQPAPEWERLAFRNDSFYMQIRLSSEMLTALDCYQFSWREYSKGLFTISNGKVYFDGPVTDSDYVEKTQGCHRNGTNKGHLGISLCGADLRLQVLDVANKDKPLEGDQYKINMHKEY